MAGSSTSDLQTVTPQVEQLGSPLFTLPFNSILKIQTPHANQLANLGTAFLVELDLLVTAVETLKGFLTCHHVLEYLLSTFSDSHHIRYDPYSEECKSLCSYEPRLHIPRPLNELD